MIAFTRLDGEWGPTSVHAWATIDVDTGELLAIKATWPSGPGVQESKSSMDALLFLGRVLGARTNQLLFVVEGGPWYSWAFRELGLEHCRGAFGDRSGVERFFGSLKVGAFCSCAV